MRYLTLHSGTAQLAAVALTQQTNLCRLCSTTSSSASAAASSTAPIPASASHSTEYSTSHRTSAAPVLHQYQHQKSASHGDLAAPLPKPQLKLHAAQLQLSAQVRQTTQHIRQALLPAFPDLPPAVDDHNEMPDTAGIASALAKQHAKPQHVEACVRCFSSRRHGGKVHGRHSHLLQVLHKGQLAPGHCQLSPVGLQCRELIRRPHLPVHSPTARPRSAWCRSSSWVDSQQARSMTAQKGTTSTGRAGNKRCPWPTCLMRTFRAPCMA